MFIRPERGHCSADYFRLYCVKRLKIHNFAHKVRQLPNWHSFTEEKVIQERLSRLNWYETVSFPQFLMRCSSKPAQKTVEQTCIVKLLPLKRQHPISPQKPGPSSSSFSPRNSALCHFPRTGYGPFDTAAARVNYFLPLGWPSFTHKLQRSPR